MDVLLSPRTILHVPFSILVLLPLLLLPTGSVSAATRYVWEDSPSPGSPYTNWATAAHVIRVAVDAAVTGDEIAVTNGTYATGGRAVGTNVLVNRVAVTKSLKVRSVNGPQVTVIQGYQVPGSDNGCGDGAIRCVYLANGATLSGFTLTNGATRIVWDVFSAYGESSGGGVWCESTGALVTNCVIAGNSAFHGGGGALGGTLNNCIDYFNTGANGANYYQDEYGGELNYCCTTPMPTNGMGNITLDPELASASHLSMFSPCRGAGSAAYTSGVDIDGEVWATPPSIGCDEYHPGAVTGPLSVEITATYTNVAAGYPVNLKAWIEG